jgi:hypothetical protein
MTFFGLTPTRILVLVALTLLAALLEGFGMAMLLPVLEFVEKGQNLEQLAHASEMWRRIVTVYGAIGLKVNLLVLIVSAVAIMLLRVAAMYGRQIYSAWLGQEIQHVTRSNLFDSYMRMDYGSFSQLSNGALINILTTETQRVAASFSALFALAGNVVVSLGFLGVLFWLSMPLTILTILLLGISVAAVSYYVRNTRRYSIASTGANERYSRLALERLGLYRLVKVTATEGGPGGGACPCSIGRSSGSPLLAFRCCSAGGPGYGTHGVAFRRDDSLFGNQHFWNESRRGWHLCTDVASPLASRKGGYAIAADLSVMRGKHASSGGQPCSG